MAEKLLAFTLVASWKLSRLPNCPLYASCTFHADVFCFICMSLLAVSAMAGCVLGRRVLVDGELIFSESSLMAGTSS